MAYTALYIKRDDGKSADLVCVVPQKCGTDLGENNPTQIVRFITDVLTSEQAEVFTIDFGTIDHVTDVWDIEEEGNDE